MYMSSKITPFSLCLVGIVHCPDLPCISHLWEKGKVSHNNCTECDWTCKAPFSSLCHCNQVILFLNQKVLIKIAVSINLWTLPAFSIATVSEIWWIISLKQNSFDVLKCTGSHTLQANLFDHQKIWLSESTQKPKTLSTNKDGGKSKSSSVVWND